MAWLRLDDGFTKHPKFEGWAPAHRWAWLEVMEYCARYRTRGRIPTDETLLPRSTTKQLLAKAETAGWCERGDDGALWINDWEAFNPGRPEDVEAAIQQAMEQHPQASANEIVRLVGGNRKQVLELIRKFRTGSSTGSRAGSEPVPEPVTRAPAPASPSRPVQELPTAASSNQEPAAAGTPNGAAAAASIQERLKTAGIAPGHTTIVRAPPELVEAWLDVADTEAKDNPGGFIVAGVRSGMWPSPRVRAQAPPDQVERRDRFVRGDGHRLPPDELEFQLNEMGAGEGELVELLDLAADLRRRSVAT